MSSLDVVHQRIFHPLHCGLPFDWFFIGSDIDLVVQVVRICNAHTQDADVKSLKRNDYARKLFSMASSKLLLRYAMFNLWLRLRRLVHYAREFKLQNLASTSIEVIVFVHLWIARRGCCAVSRRKGVHLRPTSMADSRELHRGPVCEIHISRDRRPVPAARPVIAVDPFFGKRAVFVFTSPCSN